MGKRIFYFMPVHWGWIKQRPHFLAEELAKFCELDVYYPASLKKINKANNFSSLKIKEVKKLPFSQFAFVRFLNRLIFTCLFWRKIKYYDILWLGHPALFDYFRWLPIKQLDVVYDCMDDVLEFPQVKSKPAYRRFLREGEFKLLRKAKKVFFSSETLQKRLIEKSNIEGLFEKSLIVNNALSLDFPVFVASKKPNIEKSLIKLGYFGTIAAWIDWDLIQASLERFPNIAYLFYGPIDCENPLQHERLIYAGVIEHHRILDAMQKLSALVMPFVNNKLIEAVDPVKLYEYSASGMAVIANAYEESKKFNKMIYLYQNKQEYFDYLQQLEKNELVQKADRTQCEAFARTHSWKSRAQSIKKALDL